MSAAQRQDTAHSVAPRVYPLDPRELTEEQLAVVFAMTSRRPEAFDEIVQVVTTEKAADFHERWVLNYGHASVAEHAILHMAVENISRLACDALEDNRLGSYTEKSTRFQIIPPASYYVPPEMEGHPLRQTYVETCDHLFSIYEELVERTREYLQEVRPPRDEEKESGYNLRLRREAIDSCRFILPAATLTNVGVTMNARSMEHAIRKLLSSDLAEERALGQMLKEEGRRITPTLIKYADRNDYLVETREAQRELGETLRQPASPADGECQVSLVHYDSDAEAKVVAAFLYRYTQQPYEAVWRRVQEMSGAEREQILQQALSRLGPHDIPIRELEEVYYTFDLTMDYGAYREFKRHRMQTYIPQPLTVELGYLVPPLLEEAGLGGRLREAMTASEQGYRQLAPELPRVAEYVVTHAHYRRVLSTMNLRECYHLFKLRTQPTAHFSIAQVASQAMELATEVHPALLSFLRLRS